MPRSTCSISRALASVSGRDHDVLVDTLQLPEDHPEYLTAQEIAEDLAAEGLPGKYQAVQRHRRGACACADIGKAAA